MSAEAYSLTPVILNDDLFFEFVGKLTESGTASQREAAYMIAEQQMVKALSTFLVPTSITGSYAWPTDKSPIVLERTYVQSIDGVAIFSRDDACSCSLAETEGCALIIDHFGYIKPIVVEAAWRSGCGCGPGVPYKVRVAYTAGLPTGTSSQDRGLHRSLIMLARIELLEMVNPGALEGGAGDIGVQSYNVPGYSESRVKMKKTPLGTSAQAIKAWHLVSHLYLKRPLRFG